jgi:hypothetical protein
MSNATKTFYSQNNFIGFILESFLFKKRHTKVNLSPKKLFDCNGGHLKQFQQTKSRLKLRLWSDCIFCFIHGKHVIEKSISVP